MNLSTPHVAALLGGFGAALTSSAYAQTTVTFSISWQGTTVGKPEPSTGIRITEGDILEPTTPTALPEEGPLLVPTIGHAHTRSGLGFPESCIGHPGGTPCSVEVDALSRGGDNPFLPGLQIEPGDVVFSVDRFARGAGLGPLPSVYSEARAKNAAADSFCNLQYFPPAPFSPRAGFNVGLIDGDGLPSSSGFAYPGIGAREPNSASPSLPDSGDHQDALDVAEMTIPVGSAYYFSLDSAFFDSAGQWRNSGSASAHGFVGGDILISPVPGTPALWASATSLGLDMIAGPDSDDLDALILLENGNGTFDPPSAPYDWVMGGTDMVIFSVRRGSAVIGMPDSIFGVPIEEGDLLLPPPASSLTQLPGLFIPAEALGLATVRSGLVQRGDDLTAADSLLWPLFDCDMDGIEDAVAIAMGTVLDLDHNGIPDSCE